MISDTGYEVKQAFRINGKEILLAENQNAKDDQYYLVCNYTNNGIIAEYSIGVSSDDYLEVAQEFTERVSKEAAVVQAEINIRGLPKKLFTAKECYPNDYDASIENEVVVIKSEVFSPEYRRGEYQLIWAVSGNGAKANPSGHAIYCYQLNDGTHTRFERFDVLGVIRPECLPDWAAERLATIQEGKSIPDAESETIANYAILQRITVGKKVFVFGANLKAVQPYATWQGRTDRQGYDTGHYFSDRAKALTDLHERAAKEQTYLDRPKRNDRSR
jgi:hypothetical protein